MSTILIAAGLIALASPAARPLEIDTDAVDRIFAAVDRADGPGCALGIVHDGELVYARGYGMASLEHGVPITTTTAYLPAK